MLDAKEIVETKIVERHIFIPFELNEVLKRDAASVGMSSKDYIVWLLTIKGTPVRLTYSNSDIRALIHMIEDIHEYLCIIAQGVEATGDISIETIHVLINKTDKLLESMIDATKIERMNRKRIFKEAQRIIMEGITLL